MKWMVTGNGIDLISHINSESCDLSAGRICDRIIPHYYLGMLLVMLPETLLVRWKTWSFPILNKRVAIWA